MVQLSFFLSFFPSVRFLLSPPTAPSFVVVVELQQLIGVTSPTAAYQRGRAWSAGSGQSDAVLRAVTNPRDSSSSSLKKGMTGQSSAEQQNQIWAFSLLKNRHMLHKQTNIRVRLQDFLLSECPHSQWLSAMFRVTV